jgi:urea transport system permease protein
VSTPATAARSRWTGSWRGRTLFVLTALLLLAGAPAALSDFRLGLLAKYLCLTIVALGIALSWGQGGMLTLGQGVFFGLGGYAMALYLKLEEAGPGRLPDFMSWSGVDHLPLLWQPFRHAWVALPAAVLLPMAVAAGLGALIFRQRVRGAYFAILTQALASIFVILLVSQQGLTGGTNGLTDIRELFGFDLSDPGNQLVLYLVVVLALGAAYLAARQLVASRYGRLLIAVRDAEDRVRFLGYDPALVKLVAFTASAGMAGLAGALFVPVVGIISPAQLGVVPSLELLIGVAVGGRTTLVGALLGTVLVNYAKTALSEDLASGWLLVQGALFVGVITFTPHGLAGIAQSLRASLPRRRARPPAPEPAT